jgi:hypothetical protein
MGCRSLLTLPGASLSAFAPFRGRWEIHCLTRAFNSFIVLAEYLMITIRREPVVFPLNRIKSGRVGGAGLRARRLLLRRGTTSRRWSVTTRSPNAWSGLMPRVLPLAKRWRKRRMAHFSSASS